MYSYQILKGKEHKYVRNICLLCDKGRYLGWVSCGFKS